MFNVPRDQVLSKFNLRQRDTELPMFVESLLPATQQNSQMKDSISIKKDHECQTADNRENSYFTSVPQVRVN